MLAAMAVVLLTGLPAGGATLACRLLGSLPGTRALDEPLSGTELTAPRRRGPATSARLADVVARFVSDEREAHPEDELLAVKHHTAFSVALAELGEQHRVFAVVRNPLEILLAWQQSATPVGKGHAPLAERIDPDLARAIGARDGCVDRQLVLLDWFFRRYDELLPPDAILHREAIVASGGQALATITPRAEELRADGPPRRTVSAADVVGALADRLLATDGAWWEFYGRHHVERAAETVAAAAVAAGPPVPDPASVETNATTSDLIADQV